MDLERLQSGALCSLKMGRWDARAKLDPKKLGKDIPAEILRVSRDLIEDRTILTSLAANRRDAKSELVFNSIPFPVEAVHWIPKDNIVTLDEYFIKRKAANQKLVDQLVENKSKLEANFKKKYPKYYDPSKYPSKEMIRAKFYFHWNFFQITLPDKGTDILSPKMYKREAEKFQGMIKEMEEMTISLAGHMITRRLERLQNQCSNEKFNAGTINAINKLLGRWEDLWNGHVDDKKFKSIMRSLRLMMKKTDADRLRGNEDFRNKTEKKIGSILKDLKAVPDYKLKRRLDI